MYLKFKLNLPEGPGNNWSSMFVVFDDNHHVTLWTTIPVCATHQCTSFTYLLSINSLLQTFLFFAFTNEYYESFFESSGNHEDDINDRLIPLPLLIWIHIPHWISKENQKWRVQISFRTGPWNGYRQIHRHALQHEVIIRTITPHWPDRDHLKML